MRQRRYGSRIAGKHDEPRRSAISSFAWSRKVELTGITCLPEMKPPTRQSVYLPTTIIRLTTMEPQQPRSILLSHWSWPNPQRQFDPMFNFKDMIAEPRWAWCDTLYCCSHDELQQVREVRSSLSGPSLLYIHNQRWLGHSLHIAWIRLSGSAGRSTDRGSGDYRTVP